MYKPFNKAVPPAKPNAWENAVYQYATSSLTAGAFEPKTRIEQLAKAFIFSEKAATDIRYVKEINRCIAVWETYAAYKEASDTFGSAFPPLNINVGFGKESPSTQKAAQPALPRNSEVCPPTKGSHTPLPTDSTVEPQRTEAQARLMETVEHLQAQHPNTAHGAREIYDNFLSLTQADTYRSLNARDKSTILRINKQLYTQKENLAMQEVQKLQNEGYKRAGVGLAADYYEDIAEEYREEPQDATSIPMQDDKIWAQRFEIAKTYDKEKAARLVAEFANRTLRELREFLNTYDKRTIESWEEVHILRFLRVKVNELEPQNKH